MFEEDYKVSLYGSYYREQGLLFWINIVIFIICLRNLLSRKNFHYILIAWIISAFIQSSITVIQFIDGGDSLKNVLDAKGTYGSFGQSNFLAGHILIGVIASIYFIENSKELNIKVFSKFKYVFITVFCFLFTGLIFSGSLWGIICGIIFSICYFLIDKIKLIPNLLKLIFLLSPVFIYPFELIFGRFFPIFDIRFQYIDAIRKFMIDRLSVGFEDKLKFLFGYGFDNLGSTMHKFGYMMNSNPDRAHNIIFDLIYTFGVIGFLVIFLLALKALLKIKNKGSLSQFVLIAFITLWTRNLVNTNSAVNILDFGIVLALLIYANSKDFAKNPRTYPENRDRY
jgi:hypothetical protein